MDGQLPQNETAKFPPGFENLPLEKKEAFLRGEQINSPKTKVETGIKEWYREQNTSTKQNIFTTIVTETGQTSEIQTETAKRHHKELIKKSTSNIGRKYGAEILAILNKENTPEKRSNENFDFDQNRLPPRRGIELVQKPPVQPTSISEPAPIEESVPEFVKPVISLTEKKVFDSSLFIYDVKEGDSVWKILKKMSGNIDQFKDITEAQKIYALNHIAGIIFKNPEAYGLGKEGNLRAEDKINFADILGDTGKLESIIKEAKEIITVGSPKESSTLELDNYNWVINHSGGPIQEEIQEQAPELTASISSAVTPEISEPLELDNTAQIQEEIEKAKQRLVQLESNPRNPNLERSFASDSIFTQKVEEAFRNEVNSIYGKNGFLGMGKIAGVNTKEWGEMARLPANKVVEYYTGDSTKSGLSAEIIEKLSKSRSHDAFMKQTIGLMEQSSGTVKPYENENIEQFIKRLGGYILRTHSQNLQRAA